MARITFDGVCSAKSDIVFEQGALQHDFELESVTVVKGKISGIKLTKLVKGGNNVYFPFALDIAELESLPKFVLAKGEDVQMVIKNKNSYSVHIVIVIEGRLIKEEELKS